MAALDSASSSSVASATGSSSSYEVFINFRGEDLRNNFIGFLYKILNDRGINVFLDSEKLWTGEAIGSALYEAIRGSKISIPVFSKGYADSKWCLQELAEIVQCHRSNNQIILPIFFFVDPSDVRNQTGTFEKAFQEHQKKFEDQTVVERWREALRLVGEMKGEVINDTKNQAEVVELVVKRALRELVDSTRLAECKYHIDLDSRVKDTLSLLNIGSNDVQFVGICGFGGIGKTTLAKAVYNGILSTFDNHCFLSDVRERAAQFEGLVSLQKQFLKNILKEDIDVRDLHSGKMLIEERVRTKKVFLVLDDVDSKEQIDALAGNLNWFGKGSRVIITTRHEDVLNLAKGNGGKIYRPQLLNHVQSLQLFCWHAFQDSHPPTDFMELSYDVACHSGGLPLILEVFGSYLSDLSDKDEWECTLKMLKEIPPEEVQGRLRISYDNLENDYQREIFLDAACFFIGWKKETVISIWEACCFHPKPAISRLIKRSLLKFDVQFDSEYLIMHDHIRDMGREIVKEKSRRDPSKRSRLWSYREIVEVLSRHKETNTIEGMSLHLASQPPFDLTTKSLELMPNLRFLNISSGFEYFRERSFQLPNLYHRRLVCLKVSGEGSNQLWNVRPADEHKRFQKLKVLNLSYCTQKKSPNFSWFPSLEQLDFEQCYHLKELDKSIGQLSQLKSLILKSCQSLKKLPNSVGDLKTLEKLDLSKTRIRKLPDSISQLCSLKELILKHCKTLKKLPEPIVDLKSLVMLDLSYTRMEELPDSISRMCSLKNLILVCCESLKKLPDGVGLLEKVEVLDLQDCINLVKLPRSFGGMRCLGRIRLKGISIDEFHNDFSMPPNLVELDINCLPQLQSLPVNLSTLKTLTQLKIWECEKLECISALPSCLVELCIGDCGSLVRLPDVSKLKMLRTLKLRHCKQLEEIPGLKETESLYELDARGSYNLTHAQKKIIQGRLLPYKKLLGISHGYSLTANQQIYNSGFILCLVLQPSTLTLFLESKWGTLSAASFNIDVSACIHQKDKKINCFHLLRVKDLDRSIDGDVIYICHFKGFDWFGVPMHKNDAIEILNICASDCRVKFCEVLFKNRELGMQKPCQNWNTLNWSYVDDDGGEITLDYWPIKDDKAPGPFLSRRFTCWRGAEVEGSKSLLDEKQEEERVVDEDKEEAASLPGLTLALNDDGSNQQMLESPSLVQETGLNYPSENTQVVEEEEEEMNTLDSVSDAMAEEGDMLRPGKRPRLHYETPGSPSLN